VIEQNNHVIEQNNRTRDEVSKTKEEVTKTKEEMTKTKEEVLVEMSIMKHQITGPNRTILTSKSIFIDD
jgi:hypothetical protein